jgi:predicted metal-dependent peptidase
MAMTAEEVLGQARLIVRKKTPYFRAALVALIPRPLEGLGTIGVASGMDHKVQLSLSRSAILVYDPAWLAEKTPEQVAGLLAHEILHLLNRHGERCQARDPRLFNAAGDLAINPTVREMGFQLPNQKDQAGLWPKDFGWEEGLTAEEYYRRLLEKQEQNKGGGGGADEGGVANGNCGSCATHDPNEQKKDGDQETDGSGRTDREMERMCKRVAEAIQDAAKQRGTLPAGLKRWAELTLVPPKVPWQQKLAHAIRRVCAYRPGAVVTRYDMPSRRQAGIGYGIGKPMLPRLRSPVPNVAIVVDTSGSMGRSELTACLRESSGVLRAVGAGVTFLSCDAAVHVLQQVDDPRELVKLLKGGGGTDFRPPFEELEKRKTRPEVLIFMTDGCGPAPAVEPSWCRTIWLIVGKGNRAPCDWGTAIHVED